MVLNSWMPASGSRLIQRITSSPISDSLYPIFSWTPTPPHRHAVLRVQADGIRCEDAGSLNGVFVNEDRLEGSTVLREGDTLQVGQSAVKITR